MKNWIKKLTKDQIQRIVFIALLVVVFAAFFITLSVASKTEKPKPDTPILPNEQDKEDDNNQNENPNNPKPEQPIERESFIVPLRGDNNVVRKFYDATASTIDQELAVIQFEKTYYISNGVSYMNPDKSDFNVIASLSGEVVNVEESPIYGFVITVKHDDEIYTEYGSLSSSSVNVGDKVKQGDVLGVSGVCEYDSILGSHVYFKVIKNNVNQNPEKVIGKKTNEL